MNRLNWPSLQEKRRKAKTHQAVEGKEQPGPHWGITSKLQPLPDRLETWRPRPATPTITVPHTAQFSFLPTTIKEYRTGGNQRQPQPTLSTPLWWNTSTYIKKEKKYKIKLKKKTHAYIPSSFVATTTKTQPWWLCHSAEEEEEMRKASYECLSLCLPRNNIVAVHNNAE